MKDNISHNEAHRRIRNFVPNLRAVGIIRRAVDRIDAVTAEWQGGEISLDEANQRIDVLRNVAKSASDRLDPRDSDTMTWIALQDTRKGVHR